MQHHHLTPADWERLADDPDFRALVASKRRFVVPATIFFLLYFFALPVLLGVAPALMRRAVIGPLTLAYVFAFSEFIMAWILLALYLLRARHFDVIADRIVANARETFSA
ncbi:MAG: DUF485 domain-containing protein [Vulcanimicrobiaceae bacterium]